MADYRALNPVQLEELHQQLLQQYQAVQAQGLHLDMSRGRPAADQLDLSMPMLDLLNSQTHTVGEDGLDWRNYGGFEGTVECRRLMSEIMGRPMDEIFVGGASSLNMMFDILGDAVYRGQPDSDHPWGQEPNRKFLCPVPGYDRHFAISEYFGFELVPVDMDENGPNMDQVEQLVTDPSIKGIWCVPKYSNPSGITYSDEVVRRLAAMETAAQDFRIFWDNAYGIHDLDPDHGDQLLDLMEECIQQNHPNRTFLFASTSKITFAGAGVAAFACSEENLKWQKYRMNIQTVCFDKLNMARHALFLPNKERVADQMRKQANLLRPKFETVLHKFQGELSGRGVGSWNEPRGGYFITFQAMDGCAKAIVKKCREAGVALTDAGATHPHHQDPQDSAIRIAPSLPSVDLLEQAMDIFCLCVRLVSVEKLLEQA